VTLEVGIMQGRLLPMRNGIYQGFPGEHWKSEFAFAEIAKLYCIEWVFDALTELSNPLQSEQGINEINILVKETGVKVLSLCANYFIPHSLVRKNGLLNNEAVRKFIWLVEKAKRIGVVYIVLPLLEESSLSTDNQFIGIVSAINTILPSLESAEIELLLETDLSADKVLMILEEVNHPLLGINYDIGNGASMGYQPTIELPLLSRWIKGVHVKDRMANGGTVPLGQGDADFETCFRIILESGYSRWFILEAARQDGMPHITTASCYREFVESQINSISKIRVMPDKGKYR